MVTNLFGIYFPIVGGAAFAACRAAAPN